MRFLKDGPSIPDELLNARDEARVVFFCGAGVSRARAGLSDFFELADAVISALGVQGDSPVHKILSEAREIEERTGVGGLISVDRIFGLLEREFDVNDIHSAVANSLRPKPGADLSAHRVLLDLAKTPNGKTQLVTTNFDRLFHACDPSLALWQPPRLPDPSRPSEMDGIIYYMAGQPKATMGRKRMALSFPVRISGEPIFQKHGQPNSSGESLNAMLWCLSAIRRMIHQFNIF